MKISIFRVNDINKLFYRCILLSVCLWLSACGAVKTVENDNAPLLEVDPKLLVDAIPREDPITRAGNKNPYTVLGKTYSLLSTSDGYKERGVASWYGTKFQGRPTANGEPYNLYSMTAAHRTLPIPAYVKVTNLKNSKTVIVRVNDRGPFHDNRIIDLSYAAAVKLGFEKQGTAEVLVESVKPSRVRKSNPNPASPVAIQNPIAEKETLETVKDKAEYEHYILQVGAFKNEASAIAMRLRLLQETVFNVFIRPSETDEFYRVQLGPLKTVSQVQHAREELLRMNIPKTKLIIQ